MSRMTQDDVLFGYRLQLFDLAGRVGVSAACRTFGIHRSTYYAWKRQVDQGGLEMLRPRERRSPKMPNQLPRIIEERVLAFAIAHPGLGPRRVSPELAGPNWSSAAKATRLPNRPQRVARELKAAGWQLERVLADNGNEFKGPLFHATIERLKAHVTHIHAGRPQTNGHVESLHKTMLEEC